MKIFTCLLSVPDYEKRNLVKRLCYGFIYGQGVERMSHSLNRTVSETLDLTQSFTKQYSQIAKFQSIVKAECKSCGGF